MLNLVAHHNNDNYVVHLKNLDQVDFSRTIQFV